MKTRKIIYKAAKFTPGEWKLCWKLRGFNRKVNQVNEAEKKGVDVKGLICDWLEAVDGYDNDYSTNGILSKYLGPTTPESFYRWGDRNKIKGTRAGWTWLKKEGMPLDTQLMEINEMYGTNILPDEAAEFIADYPNSPDHYPSALIVSELNATFLKEVGFNLTSEFAHEYLADLERSGDFIEITEESFYSRYSVEVEDCPF